MCSKNNHRGIREDAEDIKRSGEKRIQKKGKMQKECKEFMKYNLSRI